MADLTVLKTRLIIIKFVDNYAIIISKFYTPSFTTKRTKPPNDTIAKFGQLRNRMYAFHFKASSFAS